MFFERSKLSVKLLVGLSLVLLVPFASATILGNGGSGPPSLITPSGTLMATTSGTIITPTFTATYTSWVYSDPNDMFCAGCLDFVYQVTNSAGSEDPLERISGGSFAGFMTNVGVALVCCDDPSQVNRSANPGSVVGFQFLSNNEIAPGSSSDILVIQTNARTFQPGFISVQDTVAGFGNAFEPTLVPEPSTLMLLGSGLLGLAGFARRRKL